MAKHEHWWPCCILGVVFAAEGLNMLQCVCVWFFLFFFTWPNRKTKVFVIRCMMFTFPIYLLSFLFYIFKDTLWLSVLIRLASRKKKKKKEKEKKSKQWSTVEVNVHTDNNFVCDGITTWCLWNQEITDWVQEETIIIIMLTPWPHTTDRKKSCAKIHL